MMLEKLQLNYRSYNYEGGFLTGTFLVHYRQLPPFLFSSPILSFQRNYTCMYSIRVCMAPCHQATPLKTTRIIILSTPTYCFLSSLQRLRVQIQRLFPSCVVILTACFNKSNVFVIYSLSHYCLPFFHLSTEQHKLEANL